MYLLLAVNALWKSIVTCFFDNIPEDSTVFGLKYAQGLGYTNITNKNLKLKNGQTLREWKRVREKDSNSKRKLTTQMF